MFLSIEDTGPSSPEQAVVPGRRCRPLGVRSGVREIRATEEEAGKFGVARVASRAHFPWPSPCQEGPMCTTKAPEKGKGADTPNTCRAILVSNTNPGESPGVCPKKTEIQLEAQKEEGAWEPGHAGPHLPKCWYPLPLWPCSGNWDGKPAPGHPTNDLRWVATLSPQNLPCVGQLISLNKPPTALSVKSLLLPGLCAACSFTCTSISPTSP